MTEYTNLSSCLASQINYFLLLLLLRIFVFLLSGRVHPSTLLSLPRSLSIEQSLSLRHDAPPPSLFWPVQVFFNFLFFFFFLLTFILLKTVFPLFFCKIYLISFDALNVSFSLSFNFCFFLNSLVPQLPLLDFL